MGGDQRHRVPRQYRTDLQCRNPIGDGDDYSLKGQRSFPNFELTLNKNSEDPGQQAVKDASDDARGTLCNFKIVKTDGSSITWKGEVFGYGPKYGGHRQSCAGRVRDCRSTRECGSDRHEVLHQPGDQGRSLQGRVRRLDRVHRAQCLQGLVRLGSRGHEQKGKHRRCAGLHPPASAAARPASRLLKNNDQINAITIYNQVMALVTNFKTAAANVGINVGG